VGNVDRLRRQVTVVQTLTDLAGRLSFGPPKTGIALRAVEDRLVIGTAEAELRDVNHVMAGVGEERSQPSREVLVEEEPHGVGVSDSARSSTASAA
jgi:hypothetical protein